MNFSFLSASVLISALLVSTIGCGNNPKPASQPPAVDQKNQSSDMEKMKAETAKLSPADAAAVEKQHFCPVTDKMLGSMGPPLKVDVNGQQVWICCEGCREDLIANRAKYLSKLKNS